MYKHGIQRRTYIYMYTLFCLSELILDTCIDVGVCSFGVVLVQQYLGPPSYCESGNFQR